MKNLKQPQPNTPLVICVTLPEKLYGSRTCVNCGKTRDTYGGKECSKGHFTCKYCADGHSHCALCGHSLR